jgi:ABC-type sugar transport system ATPase subunit
VILAAACAALCALVVAIEVAFPVQSETTGQTSNPNRRVAGHRVAQGVVGIAGILQPRRRAEYRGELAAIQWFEDDPGLRFAVSVLRGAAVERVDRLCHPLVLRGVSKAFGTEPVLKNINLAVMPGTITGLTGGNGAGKSTLIKLLAGELALDGGRIQLGGAAIGGGPISGVSLVRDGDLLNSLTVGENIGFEGGGRWLVNRKRENGEAAAALATFGATIDPNRRVSGLTALERFQVRLARELVSGTAGLLLLDEPTKAMSPAAVKEAFAAIATLRDLDYGVIVVSHDISSLCEVADRVAVLRDGELVRDAPADQIAVPEIIGCIAGDPPGLAQAG